MDRVIQEPIQEKLFPVGMEDMHLPFSFDRIQKLEIKGAHEFFILLNGEGLGGGRNREKDARGSATQAGEGVLNQILVDALERVRHSIGMVGHQVRHGFLYQVPPQRVPGIEHGIHKKRFSLKLLGEDLDHFQLVPHRGLGDVERGQALQIGGRGHDLHAFGHGVVVVIHDFQKSKS